MLWLLVFGLSLANAKEPTKVKPFSLQIEDNFSSETETTGRIRIIHPKARGLACEAQFKVLFSKGHRETFKVLFPTFKFSDARDGELNLHYQQLISNRNKNKTFKLKEIFARYLPIKKDRFYFENGEKWIFSSPGNPDQSVPKGLSISLEWKDMVVYASVSKLDQNMNGEKFKKMCSDLYTKEKLQFDLLRSTKKVDQLVVDFENFLKRAGGVYSRYVPFVRYLRTGEKKHADSFIFYLIGEAKRQGKRFRLGDGIYEGGTVKVKGRESKVTLGELGTALNRNLCHGGEKSIELAMVFSAAIATDGAEGESRENMTGFLRHYQSKKFARIQNKYRSFFKKFPLPEGATKKESLGFCETGNIMPLGKMLEGI